MIIEIIGQAQSQIGRGLAPYGIGGLVHQFGADLQPGQDLLGHHPPGCAKVAIACPRIIDAAPAPKHAHTVLEALADPDW